jgi:hypothetical protein
MEIVTMGQTAGVSRGRIGRRIRYRAPLARIEKAVKERLGQAEQEPLMPQGSYPEQQLISRH